MIVMKFGGSSLGTAEKIRRCVDLVRSRIDRRPVVVVSACGKTTDALATAAREALGGAVRTEEIERLHLGLAADLGLDARIVEPLLDQLGTLLHGISLIRELTDRTLDLVMSFGERMSTRLVAAAMDGEGVPAAAVNAYDIGLVTDSRHGEAAPLAGVEGRIGEEIRRLALTPVVTGFLGKDEKGNVTTLGRNGSDYTASIVGAAVGAEEVQIWTDVDGVMTCDPSLEPAARSLKVLSFQEASELAYYGAEVLHVRTLEPAIRAGIRVRVLNTMNPRDPGTEIAAGEARGDMLAKSVVYKEDVCLVTVASHELMSAGRLLAAALDALAAHRIRIRMANTSEATVSIVTDSGYDEERLSGALAALEGLGEVRAERGKALICVVGEELRGRVGVLGRIFGAVAARGIKARMVSQSASEINVAFLVDNEQIEPAVRALHELVAGA